MKHRYILRPAFIREILIGLVVAGALAGGVTAAWWYWFRARPVQAAKGEQGKVNPPEAITVPISKFKDATKDAGIDFRHVNGSNDKKLKLLPETMGGGVAVFDFNRDGLQDILF